MTKDLQDIENQSYITFRSLILTLQYYAGKCRENWRWILAFTLAGLAFALYKKSNSPRQFEAEVSFMLNEENSGNSGLQALLGQFGGVLGSSGDINLKKILELAKTRRIAEHVLFSTSELEGVSDIMANHFITELEKHNRWLQLPFYKKEHPLKGFRFSHVRIDSFKRLENLAVKQLHQLFLQALSTESSEITGIMKISFVSTCEALAYDICNKLFDEMSQFYVNKATEKQELTYRDLKHKADSLKSLIESKEYGLAGMKDSYRSGYLFREDVPKTIMDRDIKMLSIIYGEALKNQEIAGFSLENRTPFIQAIDLPMMPLKVVEFKWIKALSLGLLGGALAGILFVVALSFYKKEMSLTTY